MLAVVAAVWLRSGKRVRGALAGVGALAVGVTAAVGSRWGRAVAGAVGVGYAAQLAVDATTPMDVPLAYPLSAESVGIALGGHSGPATALLWAGSPALLWRWWR